MAKILMNANGQAQRKGVRVVADIDVLNRFDMAGIPNGESG